MQTPFTPFEVHSPQVQHWISSLPGQRFAGSDLPPVLLHSLVGMQLPGSPFVAVQRDAAVAVVVRSEIALSRSKDFIVSWFVRLFFHWDFFLK